MMHRCSLSPTLKMFFITLIFFISSTAVFGQADTLFLKENYELTDRYDEAKYIRIIERENEDGTFKVVDWLTTGGKYFDGSVRSLNCELWVHSYQFYYPNGRVKYEGRMDDITTKKYKGLSEKTYYPNGQLRSEIEQYKRTEKFLQAFDSLGNRTIINGQGTASIELFYNGTVIQGKIKDYRQDSVWTGTDAITGKLLYRETFTNGKFITGKAFTAKGEVAYDDQAPYTFRDIDKLTRNFRRQVKALVASGERRRHYSILVVVKNGHISEVKHLITSTTEKQLDVSKLKIPTDMLFVERGVPCEVRNLVLVL